MDWMEGLKEREESATTRGFLFAQLGVERCHLLNKVMKYKSKYKSRHEGRPWKLSFTLSLICSQAS